MNNSYKISLVGLIGLFMTLSACNKEVQTQNEIGKTSKQTPITETLQEPEIDSVKPVEPAKITSIDGIFANADEVKPLTVGMSVPEFSVRSVDNEVINVKPLELHKPVVLSFFRGGWCPYCNRQLTELRTVESQLKVRGFDVWFVSIDKPEYLYSSLKQPDIGYTIYSDSELNATKTFGIGFVVDDATVEKYLGYQIDLERSSGQTHHVLPAPSTFIIGNDGKIHFQYTNPDYTVRVDPKDIITAADEYLQSFNDQ